MNNVQVEVKGSTLILTVDLSKSGGPSKSGKSDTVASTHGIVPIPGTKQKMGLNVFTPR